MLAFTFPGQGSQRPGMGVAWVAGPSWRLVDEASEVAGRDVARLLLEADADELRSTRNAQLTTFVLSLVVFDAVRRTGVPGPGLAAGHSLGEYTALTATGALSFADGVRLVAARGEAMEVATAEHPGTMAAVLGLEVDDVAVACERATGEAWVANDNAPGQVVVAGSADGVAAAGVGAKVLGAKKVLPLAVGGAFHTPLMEPARAALERAVDATSFASPEVPVVANVDAEPHAEAQGWGEVLLAQLCRPVRWRQTILRLADEGATTLVELGPGGVLTGMAKRTAPHLLTVAVAVPEDLDRLAGAVTA